MSSRARTALTALLLGAAAATGVSAAQIRGLELRRPELRAPELSVLVDGMALPEYAARGRVYVEAIKGREFTLLLRNPTDERIAVALSVDGRNVVDAKRSTAHQAAKWVLSPGQTVEIPGWQISGETARRFYFTETSRSYARWLGDTSNTGVIEGVFFRERRPRLPEVMRSEERRKTSRRDPKDSAADSVGGTQGQTSDERSAAAPVPPSAAKEGTAQPSQAPRESDEFAATGIGDRTSFPVRWVEFDEDPTPIARLAIRYEFRKELVRLGILPRGGDPSFRDRSRGFEPEYAPDPDR